MSNKISMKKLLLVFVGFVFWAQAVAQTTVIGNVTDPGGMPLPGATVSVKEAPTVATMTDTDGNYALNVPAEAKTLVFTFVSMKAQEIEIKGKTVINVELEEDVVDVGVVEVSVIGMKKDEKRIGYASTTVGGEDLTETKDRSALNALQGKVAGVMISSASGAPGSSTRVISRGFSTFNGSNQPLYIVDGVPINNNMSGSTSLNGGTDFGNPANDIDPETIESITFLKGSGATALYGSRAAAGVIVITTKKGKSNKAKGTEITISSSIKASTPLRLPQLQNVYGQGIFGNWDQRENTSYGPKFDDEWRYWGHNVDGQRLIKPYSALPNNVADFFDVGYTYQNSINVAGGDENTSYFMSYSNVMDDGIMPYNFDTYNRNNVTVTGSTKLTNKFSSSATVNYVNKKNKFVPTGQGGQSVWNNILQQPRDIPIQEMADYRGTFFNKDTYYSPYTENPYWPLFENGNENNEDRVFGRVQLSYEPNEHMSVLYRIGADVANRQTKQWRAVRKNKPASEGGFNDDYDDEIGYVSEYAALTSQLTSDFIVTYQHTFFDEALDFSILVGHNLSQEYSKGISAAVSDLSIEGFYHLTNGASIPAVGEGRSLSRLIGAFSNISLNYKGYFNLEFNGRNDWNSTLPIGNQSFFYPGVNFGYVYSEMFESVKKIIPLGKLRISWGQTGNGADPYQVYPNFYNPGRFPLPSNTNGFSLNDLVGNPNLSNELTSEIEIGTDMRFWNNRVGIDFSVYQKNITDMIFLVELAPTSGYGYQTMNLGELRNKGVELLFSLTPVKRPNFEWSFSLNFAKNISSLLTLNGELDKVDLMGLLGGTEHWFRAYPEGNEFGYPSSVGIFESSKPLVWKDPQGVEHIVVSPQGIPQLADEGYIYVGKSEHDYIIGLNNDVTIYKNLRISALFEFRKGGVLHSRTAGMTYFTGISPMTLYNDRQPFIVPNSVMEIGKDADGNPIYVENTKPVMSDVLGGSADSYYDRGGELVGGHEIIPKEFVKFRSLSITYNMPRKWFDKIFLGGASLSIIGNNLLMWTPSENRFVDPELTTYGNDLTADFGEFGATPSVRSLGFNVTFKF